MPVIQIPLRSRTTQLLRSGLLTTLILMVAVTSGCGDNNTAPTFPEQPPAMPPFVAATGTVSDPTNDAIVSSPGKLWDFTGLTVTQGEIETTVVLDFSDVIIPGPTLDPAAMVAFVDFDVDENPATGGWAEADNYRRDGALSGLGVEFQLAVTEFIDDGTVTLRTPTGALVGRVPAPVYDGKRVTIRVPNALLGNPRGLLRVSAITGAQGRPTDFIPNVGYLSTHR